MHSRRALALTLCSRHRNGTQSFYLELIFMFACPLPSVDVRLQPQRHRHGFKKLNLPADQRKALLRGLTTQVPRLDLT